MIVDGTLGPQTIQAPISFSASGDNVVILGTVGKIIKVLQLFFVVTGNTSLVFKSGSTALTGTMDMLAHGSVVLDYIQLPLTCAAGNDFIINSGTAINIGGTIWYIKS